MATAATTFEPNSVRSQRIAGIDVARALAVLGMITVHTGMGVLAPQYLAPFTGRASVLFAVLAGVSLALLSGGAAVHRGDTLRSDRRGIVIRGALLFVLGIALMLLGTPVVVILATYAVLFWVVTPLLAWSWQHVALLAAVTALVAPVVSFLVRGWVLPPTDTLGGTVTLDAFMSLDGALASLRILLIDGMYPVLTWIPFVLAGLAVGRWGAGRKGAWPPLLGVGSLLAVAGYGGSYLALHAFGMKAALVQGLDELQPGAGNELFTFFAQHGMMGTVSTHDWRWLFIAFPHAGTPFDILGSTGVAITVIAASIAFARFAPRLLVAPLSALGRMPLTVYAGHIVALWLLTITGTLSLSGFQYALFLAVPLAAAWAWSLFFSQGPLERLLSRASRPQIQLRESTRTA